MALALICDECGTTVPAPETRHTWWKVGPTSFTRNPHEADVSSGDRHACSRKCAQTMIDRKRGRVA